MWGRCSLKTAQCHGPEVVTGFLQTAKYYKLPVVILMLMLVKRRHVVMYNINENKSIALTLVNLKSIVFSASFNLLHETLIFFHLETNFISLIYKYFYVLYDIT